MDFFIGSGYDFSEDTLSRDNLWRWDLNHIFMKESIPDQNIESAVNTIELSYYFHKVTYTPIEYTACVANPDIVSASVNGSVFELKV